ncbi:hypothetical protein DK37_03725 [Halomonas sp. SUBG004]|nr:hypothetical protein DK37_03725 [Halomonas sp. SUBG004]
MRYSFASGQRAAAGGHGAENASSTKAFLAADAQALATTLGLMLGVVALLAAASALRYYQVTWIGERLAADLRQHVFEHLLTLEPSFSKAPTTGVPPVTLPRGSRRIPACCRAVWLVDFLGATQWRHADRCGRADALTRLALGAGAVGIPVTLLPIVW